MEFITEVASSSFPVLIDGETGTGKSLLAAIIHRSGPRVKSPCRTVGCGKLRPELAGSTLFGHEKGAFTDASVAVRGIFEEASGGTLVLNDIDSLSFDIQAQLLDYFDDGHVTRLGSQRMIFPDVRVIVTTNKQPEYLVAVGQLREDLFHRLNIFRHTCPALADRSDVTELANAVLLNLYEDNFSDRYDACPVLTTDALEVIALRGDWQGNCRMLSAVLVECLVKATSGTIDARILRGVLSKRDAVRSRMVANQSVESRRSENYRLSGSRQEEKMRIEEVLKATKGNIRKAARILNMSRSTMNSRIQRYEIAIGKFRNHEFSLEADS